MARKLFTLRSIYAYTYRARIVEHEARKSNFPPFRVHTRCQLYFYLPYLRSTFFRKQNSPQVMWRSDEMQFLFLARAGAPSIHEIDVSKRV
jgi:hypothetical protein